jgi:hypothetical protein
MRVTITTRRIGSYRPAGRGRGQQPNRKAPATDNNRGTVRAVERRSGGERGKPREKGAPRTRFIFPRVRGSSRCYALTLCICVCVCVCVCKFTAAYDVPPQQRAIHLLCECFFSLSVRGKWSMRSLPLPRPRWLCITFSRLFTETRKLTRILSFGKK